MISLLCTTSSKNCLTLHSSQKTKNTKYKTQKQLHIYTYRHGQMHTLNYFQGISERFRNGQKRTRERIVDGQRAILWGEG